MPTSKQDQRFADHFKDQVDVEIKVQTSTLDVAIDWISKEFDPDDIFSDKQLSQWAEANGYEKKE